MTAISRLRGRPHDRRDGSDTALSWAAITAAAGAVIGWSACCVLPMALTLAGLGTAGFSWIAGQRVWLTVAAMALIGAGWALTARRARLCRRDGACPPPNRLSTVLLGLASCLVIVAIIWQPLIEPWALALIRGARG